MSVRGFWTKQRSLVVTPVAHRVLQRCGSHTCPSSGCRTDEEESRLQRQRAWGAEPDAVPPIVEEVLRSPCQPLDARTRAYFEPRFGHDFSQVRVHTDARAEESARAVKALAYTVGRDVVFGSGQYRPGTVAGDRLLAHELVHVAQQQGHWQGGVSGASVLQRACGPAAVGTPVGCAPLVSEPLGELVLFRVDCDEFLTPSEQTRVEDFVDSMTDTDRVNIHGFASLDGQALFNERLACARALKARDVLVGKGVAVGQTTVFSHGPTAGTPRDRRSVVLERIPAMSRPAVPQLSTTVVSGPNRGACAIIDLDARWQLGRNAAANGGYVVQEATRTYGITNCHGGPVSGALPNPLTFYEAWRVAPNSRTFDAADGDIDTWSWTANLGGPCTDGWVRMDGRARYYDDVPVADMPAHMVRNNNNTLSGGLRSSTTNPNLGGNPSREVVRLFSFSWTCCPCQSSATVVEQLL